MRILTAVGLLFLTFVTGCAQPADPKRMTVTILPSEAPFPAALSSAICVRSVTGGEPTNPLWVAKVDNAEFKTALADSLRERGLLARPEGVSFSVGRQFAGSVATGVRTRLHGDDPCQLQAAGFNERAGFIGNDLRALRLG